MLCKPRALARTRTSRDAFDPGAQARGMTRVGWRTRFLGSELSWLHCEDAFPDTSRSSKVPMRLVRVLANHYETLGVDRDATTQEIKRAFRKLAAKYHPDVSKLKDTQNTFRTIVEAYKILGDSEKKKRYDRDLRRQSLKMMYQTRKTTKTSNLWNDASAWNQMPNFEEEKKMGFDRGQHYYTNYAYSYWDVSSAQDYASESQRRYEEERRHIAFLRDKWRRVTRRRDLNNESMRQPPVRTLNQLDFLFMWIFLALWSTRGSHAALLFLVAVLSFTSSVATGYKISAMAALSFGSDKGIWLGISLVLLSRFCGNFPHKVVGILVLSTLLGGYLLAFTPIPSSVLCYLTYKCIKLSLS